jgi:hypothetical protein
MQGVTERSGHKPEIVVEFETSLDIAVVECCASRLSNTT